MGKPETGDRWSSPLGFSACRTVEDHPGTEVLCEIHKAVFDTCGHEKSVPRRKADALLAKQELTATRMDDVDFILIVGFLFVTPLWPVIAELERTVLESNAILAIVGGRYGRQCFTRCHAFGHGFGLEYALLSLSILS